MNPARITLLGSQERRLLNFLTTHPNGHERAAAVLFRRFRAGIEGLESTDRYVAVAVVEFDDSWLTGSSPVHVAFKLEPLRELFRRCEEEGLVFGFVHSHPPGADFFSDVDDDNERTLLKAISNRNGRHIHFVALIRCGQKWLGRTRSATTPEVAVQARHILVLGDRIVMHGHEESSQADEVTARQAAAFGQPFVGMMRSLRIGIVGAGGTGSPTATLLARSGVGELIIYDPQDLERSNLNRVRGAAARDVGTNKAEIQRKFINDHLELPCKVGHFTQLIDVDPNAIDALATCDIVFGCTDDQIGRDVLNASIYFHGQPLIDMGLGGRVCEDASGTICLRHHHGRVSTIFPEHGDCLYCQGVIKDVWIQHAYALRENPNMTPEEARVRYLEGSGEIAPGVAPFTSAAADFAVATLFDLLRPFRRFGPHVRRDLYFIDFVLMEIRSHESHGPKDCPFCKTSEFTLKKERARLDRPALGRRTIEY